MYYGFYDPTYFLVLIGVIISAMASMKIRTTFARYNRVMSSSGFTGREIAQHLLRTGEMGGVDVHHIPGSLTDHFDPRSMSVGLSDSVYNSNSIAALAVASHECGHVMQKRDGYLPYNLRHVLVPLANFGSRLSWLFILVGVFLGSQIENGYALIELGLLLFSAAVAFQIVTLPVELNASRRALALMRGCNRFSEDELRMAKKVLSAAALTYVAAALASILQMARLVLLFGRRRR